ncbi:CocE/NonD family hydrolase [Nocardioides jiangxiensis]|uniref:CocE/NonD family hydrolase n=1 Tax=Nocardioides jiangxiensis TaxID=3064524 RepID=A0ABT9AZT9_9ACTN|nr:CocE/NonD family hydrolase [Nocardioides sp. WY-20]MDO7868116.1 CocE/NonD family hydrolase [Nocardioides sp. WY-20]
MFPRSRARRVVPLAGLAAAATALVAPALPAVAGPAYSVQTLHFAVTTGPDNGTACDIIGDLYLPSSASPTSRVPAILTTNGFGGSKDDQAAWGASFATNGYAVLSYSGLGFGGSSCKITLDDPDWDGKAASQLVSYLGGRDGIAYADAAHTQPVAPLEVVQRDQKDHDGVAQANDPRVGLIGGSYGGGFQFAAAGIDHRVDALVPIITWNDLSYSLAPNNTDKVAPGRVTSTNSGATKLAWGLGFSALGLTGDLQNQQVPGDPLPCPNFADWVCPALVTAGTTGYFDAASVAAAQHASVASYMANIEVPTLLLQGQADTLFNLNEAVATYQALKAQGTTVKMVWQHFGHSSLGMLPGENDYLVGRAYQWFDRYLKGLDVSTGPEFAYYRDWLDTGDAGATFATSRSFPVGSGQTWKLSGGGLTAGALTTGTPLPGTQAFVTPAAGLPTSFPETDVLGGVVKDPVADAVDVPGTYAAWSSPVLGSKVDVVGSPVATLKVDAPSAALTQGAGEAGQLVLFLKVQDVDASGHAVTINALEAPVRVADVTKPFTTTLPAIVHRFAPGHTLRFVVAGGSVNYRGGIEATPVTITSGGTQTLTLPVVP